MNFLKNLITGQIVKGYTINGDGIANVGHHKSWKLYKGKKDSTNTQVSIFVIQKKQLKSKKQQILKSARKQATSLSKIRHPGVLSIIQPLTQDQTYLSFVTQKVQGNISLLIKQKRLSQFLSSQLELKLNLFPLLETINFLHQIVKLSHLAINFQSVFITPDGKWKIAGMGYTQQLVEGEQHQLKDIHVYDYLHCAPEIVRSQAFTKLSDSFSVGVLIVDFLQALKNQGIPKIVPTESKQAYQKNIAAYLNFHSLAQLKNSQNASQLCTMLSTLLSPSPQSRLSISILQSSPWLNPPLVLTIKYLQNLSNYQHKQQLQFLKGLAGVIQQFDVKILHSRVVGILCNLLKFNHLVASLLFIVIDLMKRNILHKHVFQAKIWGELKYIAQAKEMTAQSLYLLVFNMQTLQKYIKQQDFMATIIPLYLKCFDCPPKLKVLALKNVLRVSKKYDYQFLKTKIVPKLILLLKDEKTQIRKDTLKVLYSIVSRLDPQTIVTMVLNGLQTCRKVGADGFINTITVEIYNKITNNLSPDVLATKIMPGIMAYLIDPAIQEPQFAMYKNALMNMMNKIQDDRKKTWKQQNLSGVVKSHQKFTQQDFILQSNQNQKQVQVKNSQSNFDFLNEYTKMSNTVKVEQQNRTKSDVNIKIGDQLKQNTIVSNDPINSSLNFGSQFLSSPSFIPQQTPKIIKAQKLQTSSFTISSIPSKSHQQKPSTIVSQQFSNQIKINTQFNTNLNEIKSSSFGFDNLGLNYQPMKYQPPQLFANQTNIENDDIWNIDSNKQTNLNINSNDFKLTSNTTFTKPLDNNLNSNKQQPFSPSTTQHQQINQNYTQKYNTTKANDINVKDFGESTMKVGGSPTKKLIGPSGGLKKPPKYNQFNLHLKQQTESTNKPSIINNPKAFTNSKADNYSNLINNNLNDLSWNYDKNVNLTNQKMDSNNPTNLNSNLSFNSNLTFNSSLPFNSSNSDPFAQIQQTTINSGVNYMTSNNYEISKNNEFQFNQLKQNNNNKKPQTYYDDLI